MRKIVIIAMTVVALFYFGCRVHQGNHCQKVPQELKAKLNNSKIHEEIRNGWVYFSEGDYYLMDFQLLSKLRSRPSLEVLNELNIQDIKLLFGQPHYETDSVVVYNLTYNYTIDKEDHASGLAVAFYPNGKVKVMAPVEFKYSLYTTLDQKKCDNNLLLRPAFTNAGLQNIPECIKKTIKRDFEKYFLYSHSQDFFLIAYQRINFYEFCERQFDKNKECCLSLLSEEELIQIFGNPNFSDSEGVYYRVSNVPDEKDQFYYLIFENDVHGKFVNINYKSMMKK